MSVSEESVRATQDLLKIVPIFSVTSKKDLLKFVKDLEVTERGLVALILTCGDFGFEHARVSWEWVPHHLELDANAIQKIKASEGAERLRLLKRTIPVFEERRLFTGHLFWRGGKWHLFFFDQRDVAVVQNHWKHGPHIHFLNQLIRPNVTLREILDELNTERPRLKSGLHIRYVETTQGRG